jgi:hypothetical protein
VPRDTFEFRIAYRKLLLGLLLTVVPISLVALYAISQGASSLRETIGSHYSTIAEAVANQVTQFVHDRVIEVGLMAANPAVIAEINAANRSYENLSEAAIADKIRKTEEIWLTSEADALAGRILSSPASQSLRSYLRILPYFLRITVTDERGATAASTHKTIDYYQADEPYWQNIYAQGRGAISLTDIEYDVVTKNNYIGIGVPILDEDSRQLIGTLDALVEVSSVFPLVRQPESGTGGSIYLVKDDGTVITGPKATLSMNLRSDEYGAVVDAMRTIVGREAGYVVADFGNQGERVIGFADTGLKEDFEALSWVVLASQPAREAFSPIAQAQRPIMVISFLSLAAVVFLGVYFSLHRKGEVQEMREEFHPAHPNEDSTS